MEETYIIQDGIRIGYFQSEQDAHYAMSFCRRGFVVPKSRFKQ